MAQRPVAFTPGELADYLGGRLDCPEGVARNPELRVTGLAPLLSALEGQLSFLARASLASGLETTRASVVLVNDSFNCSGLNVRVLLLRVKNAYFAYAQASSLFDTSPRADVGIHPSAVVHASARVAASACIGAHVVIEAGAIVGEETVLDPGVVIGAGTRIGKHCHLRSHVSVYHGVVIGDRVRIHSGAVIGADGFGFAAKPGGGWQKIHQLGGVSIGNDVEIGANTTIDRGAIDDTVIEDGAIIDNLVQIAHNVHIGKNTAIAGCVGIAGSTRIGANCTIAGAVGIVGHLTIADNVHITGMSMVSHSIDKPGSYSGGTGVTPTADWRRNAVRFTQLDSMAKRIKELEKKT